jgi:hypothetical protein
MNLLTSNLPPLKLSNQTFSEAFNKYLDCSSQMDIAVGYITADSLAWLHQALKTMTNIESVNLVIGMHYWEKFTKREYKAASEFDTYLRNSNRGCLKLVKAFKYHGKLYSWSDNTGVISGVVGSDNLSGITSANHSYEVSAIFNEHNEARKIKSFIDDLSRKSTVDLLQYEQDERGFRTSLNLLEGHEGVTKYDPVKTVEISHCKTDISFQIPLKGVDLSLPRNSRDGSKSNLNYFFSKGRKTPSGRYLPRPWYEVELIPGKEITSLPNYPKKQEPFTVVTEDGWTFDCSVQGGDDGKKNFRSLGDLQTLGMWIKGRMEDEGVLDIGELVTTQTISNFGIKFLKLTKTSINNTWFLEFGEK